MSTDGDRTVDVLRYETPSGREHEAVPAGKGPQVVDTHETEERRRRRLRIGIAAVGTVVVSGIAYLATGHPAGVLAGGVLALAAWVRDDGAPTTPELVAEGIDADRARRTYDLEE